MADLQEELQRFLTARFGVDVKDAFVSCIQKIHKENQDVAALEQPMKDATQQVLDIREEVVTASQNAVQTADDAKTIARAAESSSSEALATAKNAKDECPRRKSLRQRKPKVAYPKGIRTWRDDGVAILVRLHDCCKIVSAQAKLDEDIWDMEMVKHTFPSQFIPLGTIVTVFGTGSEMNAGAVITHEEKKLKSGIFGAQADFAFLDPAYTLSVPFGQVISGAFDTLSHAMETYFGKPDENNLSDDLGEAVMRSVIRNIRVLMQDHDNYEARSELAWASAMAENGVLKIGKVTDFQAHQIEHQLGAYTNCNHGKGLAVIHPVLYRHICAANPARFARFAENVWGIQDSGTDSLRTVRLVKAGIEALAAFIKEIGLPTTFAELGIPEDTDLRAVADSTNITAGCCKKLTHDEIYEILLECR